MLGEKQLAAPKKTVWFLVQNPGVKNFYIS